MTANTQIQNIAMALTDRQVYTPALANKINKAIDGNTGYEQYRAVANILKPIHPDRFENISVAILVYLGLYESIPRNRG